MSFKKIGQTMASYIAKREELYLTEADPKELVNIYREGFPEGKNPIFNERREYDCNSCFHFIRHMGVTVDEEGKSIFRCKLPYPLSVVAEKMAEYVESREIISPFFTKQPNAGQRLSILVEPVQGYSEFYHFYFDIKKDGRFFTEDAPTKLSKIRGKMVGLENSLVSLGTLGTLSDLISEGLYRGEAYHHMVLEAITLRKQLEAIEDSRSRELFFAKNYRSSAALLKNSALGLLLSDLEVGIPLTEAEQKYLRAVDPINYKRATTMAGERQVKKALNFLKEEGYEESILRKHATLGEIIHHKIWTAPPKVAVPNVIDDMFAELPTKKSQPMTKGEGQIVTLKELMAVIQKSDKVEIKLTQDVKKHLATPSMPLIPTAKPMYLWDCGFGWTYTGGLSDVSNITEAVKKHSGNISAPYRFSLSWFATDDLDIALYKDGKKLYYGCRQRFGWTLDVDMNADKCTTDAIENIYSNAPEDGVYTIKVHQFYKGSEVVKPDFYVEIKLPNFHKILHHPERLGSKVRKSVATIEFKAGKVVKFSSPLNVSEETIEATWYDVSTILKTPKESALEHIFFVLDGYKNKDDSKVRAFFLDAMKSELQQHRKVLELVGDKASFSKTDTGATMLGIAANKDNLNIEVKVNGKPYKVVSSK